LRHNTTLQHYPLLIVTKSVTEQQPMDHFHPCLSDVQVM
jgi:hypothetical protein